MNDLSAVADSAPSAAMDESEAAFHESHGHARGSLAALTLGAVGVVFGDIGTSPLYAMKEVFVGHQCRKRDGVFQTADQPGSGVG